MKNLPRKLLSLLLSASLCLGLVPAAAALSPTPMADDITSRPLRILFIGHSFGVNATEYLYAVSKAEGLDTIVGLVYYSGCNMQQHVDFAQSNSAVYTYYKNKDNPNRTLTYNQTMHDCIVDEPWDIIVLMTGPGAKTAAKYQPHLDNLMAYVDEHKTNPNAQYAWHMYWSAAVGFTGIPTATSQMNGLLQNITAAQEVIVPKPEFKAILPTGPAIQTARSSFIGDTLCYDGQHLNELGRLIAAYTIYCAFTGKTLTELKHPYAAATAKASARVSEEVEKVIVESVNDAIAHPFEFTPSIYSLTPNAHWSWQATDDASANAAALAGSTAQSVNAGNIFTADGPAAFTSYSMTCGDDAFFELADLSPLDASSCDVANLSMNCLYPNASPAESQSFLRNLRVQVSVDGETWLPDSVGIRSAILLGGGTMKAGTEGILFRLETENLLDIPGVTDTSSIRKIRVYPGANPFGAFTLQSLAVNCYVSRTGFEMAIPGNDAAVQAVAAPLVAGGSYTDGVHISAASDEAITGCTVTLHNVSFESDVFTKSVPVSGVTGVNFENAELNTALGNLIDSEYRIDVSVTSASGTATRSFEFSHGRIAPCVGNHAGRTALTQAYLETLSTYQPSGTGPAWTLPSGDYYLEDDLVLTKSLRIPGGNRVTLCLNGHTLRGALAANKDNMYYYNAFLYVAGTVEICDHAGGGKVQVNAYDEVTNRTYVPWLAHVDGKLNLYSGSICDSHCRNGAIRVNNGTFNMYGGKITGNRNVPASSGAISGGAVYMAKSGSFNLYDGEISGNGSAGDNGTLGAAVVTVASTEDSPVSAKFNMYGGKITGNTALRGSAVLIYAGSTFNMYGGEISHNTADRYGAVYVNGTSAAPAAVHMSGGLIDSNVCTATSETYGRGGGVTVGAYGLYDFSGGTVTGNKSMAGGGIYLNSATASLETTYDAVITGNVATSSEGIGGGGVAAIGGTVNLSGGQIINNSAVHQGGGVSVTDGTITVINVRIKENVLTGAGALGGGMFVGSTDPAATARPTLTISAGHYNPTTVAGDTAGKGSALYLAHGDGEMLGGSIIGTGATVPALQLANTATFVMYDGTLSGGVDAEDGSSFANSVPGDMNSDGLFNAKDVVLLMRHLAGGYGVTLHPIKADLDSDGEITIADAVLLMRYLAGGYGVTLT